MKRSPTRQVRTFTKLQDRWNIPIPNLLDVQLRSFRSFLQEDTPPEERKNEGLQEVYNTLFPITEPSEI